MKKKSAFIVFTVFSIILFGSSSTLSEKSSYSKSILAGCPYLNQIHSSIESAEKPADVSRCPYIKSQKTKIKKNGKCPFREKQKQIYYEMNKKRAAEVIKLS